MVQNLRIALSRVFISFEAFLFLKKKTGRTYIELERKTIFLNIKLNLFTCTYVKSAAKGIDPMSLTTQRSSPCYWAFRLTLIKKDRQNGGHKKGRVFIEEAEH